MNRVYGDLATPVADGDEIAFSRLNRWVVENRSKKLLQKGDFLHVFTEQVASN